ncbi:MAG: hypothetical protein AAB859_01490, partial [Patescibacteria group bacterium]
MNIQEIFIIAIYGIFSLFALIKGLRQSIIKKNPFGTTEYFFWLGIFAWGDGIIIGPFWFLASLTSFLLKDWNLFLLTVSAFWLVRSFGETIYWLNQQFVKTESNYYQKVMGYRFFKNDS